MLARIYGVSAIRIDFVCSHKLLVQMPCVLLAYLLRMVKCCSHTGHERVLSGHVKSYEILQNRLWYHKVADRIARYKGINDLGLFWLFTVFQARNGVKPTIRTLA